MRRSGAEFYDHVKATMLDEIVDIILGSENGVFTAPVSEVKKYNTPAAWAGYKIMRYLYNEGVIESGGAQETLDLKGDSTKV